LDYLRQKKILLVMDNFEHVLPGVAFVMELLQTVPEVKVLVTSRQRLNLVDEAVISLSGLDCPIWTNDSLPSADLSAYEAVQLLVQSARRVQPDFELQPQDYEAAARLCSLVEGMPLAIILAAGWLEMLTMGEVVEEITHSLDFLESLAHDIPERQRSLRAVFNASWTSLVEGEREVLERLTIFQGSFTRQAALAFTKTSLATLLSLIQKAWLQRNQDGRFQIHELQRQYAFEKLQANPPDWEQARDEHSAYNALRLRKLAEKMRGADQEAAFDEITPEFENIRLAWDWLVERKQFEALVHQALPPIYRYCEARIKSRELLQFVAVALPVIENSSDVNGLRSYLNILLIVQASFYKKGDSVRLDRYDIMIPPAYEGNIHRVGDQVAAAEDLEPLGLWGILFAYLYGRFVASQKSQLYLRQLIEHYRQEGQLWELACALQMLGGLNLVVSLNSAQKEPVLAEAGQCLTEALALFEQLGDQREYSYTLLLIGGYHANLYHWQEAISIWRQAQAKFDQIGDTVSSIHWLLGGLLFKIGDYEAAFQYYRESSEKYIRQGYKRIAAYALSFESIQALRYSTINHAQQTRKLSLSLSQEVGDHFGEAWSTWEMGEIQRVAGDYDAARLWFERSNKLFQQVNDSNGAVFYHRGLGDIALAEGDEAQAYRFFESSLEHARQGNFIWGEAYALAGMARAALALKNIDAAQKHLSAGLQSASTIRDSGLALVLLAGCAQLYAQRGEIEPAFELSSLVAGHFAAWRETKTQATTLLNDLRAQTPDHPAAVQEPGSTEDVWEMANRLFEADFKPT
jgi:tetratricopeptide (TPR) repeat protein